MILLKQLEYIHMNLSNIPNKVVDHYELKTKASPNGSVFVVIIKKGMYRLPHTEIITQKLIEEWLTKHGSTQSDKTPGFWKHDWRPISFSLIVDNLWVKYMGKEYVDHLINFFEEFYVVNKDY